MRLSARGKTARHFKRRSPILRSPGKIDFRRAPRCFPVSPTSIKRGTPKPGRTVSFLLPTTRCTNTSARETYMSRWALQEAQLALLNTRLDLAVLIFPDFNENFELTDDLHAPAPLPTLGEVQQQAAQNNPDVRAALETVRAAGFDVTSARAGYLPSLSFDYWYGIDAPQFAVNGTNGVSNLGASILGTLNIPIWNWGATQSRVKQAELRRAQAQREVSLAQRRLLAEIKSLYSEAETAMNELGGLGRSAELAEESLRLTTLRYKGGEATVLEVVDAQTTYAQSNAAYQDGAVRYRAALANLQTLTGVLTAP